MNIHSLRARLIGWYAGLLICVFVLFGLAMYQALERYLERSLRESLVRRGEQIAALLTQSNPAGETYVIDEIKARYAPESYDRFIRIARPDGSVLYSSGRTATFDPSGLPALIPATTRRVRLDDGNELMMSTRTLKRGGAEFLIQTAGPMQPIDIILTHLLSSLLLGLPVLVIVTAAGGYYLVGRALGPVARAARSAERISLQNLSERLPVHSSGDELEQLTVALNGMISRLSEALQQNQRFLADASHELRTPLAALYAELESIVSMADPASEVAERIGSSLEELDRLIKIVEALFAISRIDAGEAAEEWAQFDLARLAVNTTDQLCLLAEDKGVNISCEAAQRVSVQGNASRIKQVIVNLLDNAIKYTPANGRVKLTVQADHGKAVVEVADTGIGIPAEALPRVFDRFFRVDKARSRELGGAGLGLAIVKSICAAHNGHVAVESFPGHGSRFRVELPLASAP